MTHVHVTPRAGESSPFHFDDQWTAEAEAEAVWAILERVEEWPQWWRGLSSAEPVGERLVCGSRARILVHTPLGTPLRFVIEAQEVRAPQLISFSAHGDLRGHGVWTLKEDRRCTQIESLWCVTTARRSIRMLRPLSGLMHAVVMRAGERGLAARLAAGPPQA
ncbi:SRPBCC family protein [Brevibacterium renqingii]|jgi:uncharacterized protein YndB with AHSA1/START domain|uniref:SRPBCC family protein n=1 Tax=Brevibacterium renqingii TaxID=2776916 RepID=UPI001AE07DF2|nr:SRPBCC family protein [Brevibacterium renqingii]